MAIATLNKLDKIVLPGGSITQINSMRWLANIDSFFERGPGHPHPQFRGTSAQKPAIEFSTSELDTLLALVPLNGLSQTADTDTYFKAATVTGTIARASSLHKQIKIAESLIYWTSISLPHNGRGEVSVMIVANYDGTNAPFVYAGTVALAGNLLVSKHFGAGPVEINGANVPGVKDIQIDSGIQLIQEGSSSEVYDTFTGIQQTEPTVTITTLEETNWSTLGAGGLVLNGSTGLECWARKFTTNETGGVSRVADGTAEHVKFTGLNGVAIPVDSSGEGSSPISDTLRIELTAVSDSVLPLTIATTSTIA